MRRAKFGRRPAANCEEIGNEIRASILPAHWNIINQANIRSIRPKPGPALSD